MPEDIHRAFGVKAIGHARLIRAVRVRALEELPVAKLVKPDIAIALPRKEQKPRILVIEREDHSR